MVGFCHGHSLNQANGTSQKRILRYAERGGWPQVPSDGDDDLSPDVPCLEVADRLGQLA